MRNTKGFTLLELMITVAVVAILMSLAIPSYRNYVIRADRTSAIEAISASAACLERNYSRSGAYIYDDTCKITPKRYNQLAITNLNTGQGFRITATPNGGQTEDSCGSLSLDHTGQKTRGGSGKTDAECWAGR